MAKLHYFLSFLSIFFHLSFSLTINQYEIRDLERDSDSFVLETKLWQITNNMGSSLYTMCNGVQILGGYNVAGSGTVLTRTYSGLSSHNVIRFSIQFWVVDLATSTDLFQIYFDNTLVGKWDSSSYNFDTLGATNICGGSKVDYPFTTVEGSVPHTASTLTVKIVSLATSSSTTTTTTSSTPGGGTTTGSITTVTPAFNIGIRDVNLLFKTSTSTPSLSICKFVSYFDPSSSTCFCSNGYYDPVGYFWCTKCNAACANCTGPGAGDCTACAAGYHFSGTKCVTCDSSCGECSGPAATQCTSCASGKYLYWDNTCRSSCDSPLVKGTEGLTCSLPCEDNEFYYQNGTCDSACNSPFVESSDGDLDLCNFLCGDGKFYNWKGVCQDTCDEPFIQNLKGFERYCEKPCGDTNYLYENDTCEATCEYPFVEDDSEGYLQCNFICEDGEYLNWQDTCQVGCESPYIKLAEGVERYCLKPCGDNEFLYSNNTCSETCETPFVEASENGYKTCNFPCEDNEFLTWDNICQAACDEPFIQITEGVEKYCNSPCSLSDYLYENATCQTACAENFFEVDVRSIKYCNFSCDNFMYWNDTCQENCETPLVQILEGVERYCRPPCEEGEFYYENETCSASCEAPFIKGYNGDFKICVKPCSEFDYLYWNGSCLEDCPSLFRGKIDEVRTCSFHCDDGFYQYWNGSCLSTCDSPLNVTLNEDYKYCERPCDNGEYLYANGTCLTECNYQIVVDENGVSSCTFPCEAQEYLYQNDTCKTSCPSPYESSTSSDNFLLCDSPCDSDEYYRQELASCVSHCSFPLTIRTEGLLNICENSVTGGTNSTDPDDPSNSTSVLTELTEELENLAASFSSLATAASEACSFIRPNDPNSGFVISSAKSTKHIKLLGLSVYVESNSSRLLEEEDSDDDSSFSLTSMFTYKMPKSLKSRFESQSLPTALQGKVLHSSFLVNFWESLTTFLSLIVLGIFFIICDFIAKKTKRPMLMAFMQKLRTLTEWNFLIFIFLNCYDDITLYTIIELKTLKLDSFYAVVSFMVCLSVCFVGLYLLYKIIKITKDSLKLNRQIADAKATIGPEEEFCKKYSKYQVMHVGYENTSFWKQAFLLFYVGKIVLSYIVIGCLYNYPVVQTSLLTSFSVLMIFYLIKTKPTYDRFHLLIILIFEILALITNICMIILAVLSTKGASHIALQERLAKIIVIADLANGLAASFVLWAYVLMAIYAAFKKTREPGIESKTAWLNVLVAPFQTPGMEYYEEEDTMASEEDIEKGLKPRRRRRIRPSRRRVQKNKVQPAMTLVKYDLDSMNVLPQDDTLTTGSGNQVRTTPPGRLGTMPTLQAFLRIESDGEAPDQDFTFVMSPDSISVNLPSFSPVSQLSPVRRELLKSGESGQPRKSQFSRLRTPTQGPMMTLERYLPSVIIEETSPGNRKGDEFEPETPAFHQKAKGLINHEEIPRENTLLKSRGLTRLRKIPTGQSAEEDVSLDFVIESKPRYNHSDSDHESTKAFSKMVRTWKNRTSQEEGGLGSTVASINSDLLSNLDDKGTSARGFLRSDNRRRRLTENLSRSSGRSDLLRSRDSAGSGSGPVTLRESPNKNSGDEGDLMFVTNYDEGEKRNSAYNNFNYKGHF